jgi:hypothetical protein
VRTGCPRVWIIFPYQDIHCWLSPRFYEYIQALLPFEINTTISLPCLIMLAICKFAWTFFSTRHQRRDFE